MYEVLSGFEKPPLWRGFTRHTLYRSFVHIYTTFQSFLLLILSYPRVILGNNIFIKYLELFICFIHIRSIRKKSAFQNTRTFLHCRLQNFLLVCTIHRKTREHAIYLLIKTPSNDGLIFNSHKCSI